MNYEESVKYIEAIPRFTKKHSLEHTREFMKRLGFPGEDRKIIHVAGTNGKGSVCAYIRAIFEAEGKETGFFTSPHLVSINERIQINGKQISNDDFYGAFSTVLSTARSMEKEGLGHPSYFEFLYGLGMTAFSRTDAEYIILETGLGGRLDATNCVTRPLLTVITSISLDHTDILGDTIEKIAAEKAGIIKEGVPVFFDGSSGEASRVIKKKADEKNAPCREISKNAFEIQEVHRNYIAFSRANAYDKDIMWRVPICGYYQVMNAEIALEAAEYALRRETVHKDRWVKAIAAVQWEGRMEEAAPHLILDGAHNPGAIEAFVKSVHMRSPLGADLPVLIFSAVSDKKYEQMIACLCEGIKAKAYIVTEIEDNRAVPAEELQEIFLKYTKIPVLLKKDLKEALKEADTYREGDGEIYCIGSLYLVGMVKELLSGGNGYA